MNAWYYIGQGFGALAVVFGFISLQMKNAKHLVALQAAVSTVFCIHYFLIGATTGFVMNIGTLIRNAVFAVRSAHPENRFLRSPALTAAFTVIMVGMGVWAWEDWYSVFMILGLAINTVGMSMRSADNIRRSTFITCPFVIAYNALASSYGGIVYESTVMVSSAIGLIRSSRRKKREALAAANDADAAIPADAADASADPAPIPAAAETADTAKVGEDTAYSAKVSEDTAAQ